MCTRVYTNAGYAMGECWRLLNTNILLDSKIWGLFILGELQCLFTVKIHLIFIHDYC